MKGHWWGEREQETERWIRGMAAVMQMLCWSIVVKREPSIKDKLSIKQAGLIAANSTIN